MFHCVINWTFRFSNLNERIFTLTLFITRTTKNESWVDDNFILKKIQTSSIEWTNPNSNFDFIRCHCELNVWQNNPSQKKTHTQNTCKFLSIFSFFLKTKKKNLWLSVTHKIDFLPKEHGNHTLYFELADTITSQSIFYTIFWINETHYFFLFLWILIETNILIHLNDLEHKNFAQCFFFLRRLIVSNFGSLQLVHS